MLIELKKHGLSAVKQQPIKVYYDEEVVGEYFSDLIVEDKVIIELKANRRIAKEHEVQIVNYLKATDIEVGLLLNFSVRSEFKRKVFSNDY